MMHIDRPLRAKQSHYLHIQWRLQIGAKGQLPLYFSHCYQVELKRFYLSLLVKDCQTWHGALLSQASTLRHSSNSGGRVVAQSSTNFSSLELAQLHQVEVALRVEAPQIGIETPADYVGFFKALYSYGRARTSARMDWDALQSNIHTISSYQRQVYTAMCSMNLDCQSTLEYFDSKAEFSIDIAIPRCKVAVEADGPTHFAFNSMRPLGATSLKRRLLKGLGWKVIAVPYFEWNRCKNEQEQQAYILNKLTEAGITAADSQPAVEMEEYHHVQMGASTENTIEEETDKPDVDVIKARGAVLDRLAYGRGSMTKAKLLSRGARRATSPSPAPRVD